jgi:hypothetical protein
MPDLSLLSLFEQVKQIFGSPSGRPPHSSSTSIKTRSVRRKRFQQDPTPGFCELERVCSRIRQSPCQNLAIDRLLQVPGRRPLTTRSKPRAFASA